MEVSSNKGKGRVESKSPMTRENIRHITTHLGLLPSLGGLSPCLVLGPPASRRFVCRSARTKLVKRSSTLYAVLADVSINSHPNVRASAMPSSRDTSRSYVLSHLLPTSMKIGFCRLTLSIDCRNTSRRSKVDREAIEYTRMKPCPSLWLDLARR